MKIEKETITLADKLGDIGIGLTEIAQLMQEIGTPESKGIISTRTDVERIEDLEPILEQLNDDIMWILVEIINIHRITNIMSVENLPDAIAAAVRIRANEIPRDPEAHWGDEDFIETDEPGPELYSNRD